MYSVLSNAAPYFRAAAIHEQHGRLMVLRCGGFMMSGMVRIHTEAVPLCVMFTVSASDFMITAFSQESDLICAFDKKIMLLARVYQDIHHILATYAFI